VLTFDQNYRTITSTDQIGKFDSHIFIVDKSVIRKIDPSIDIEELQAEEEAESNYLQDFYGNSKVEQPVSEKDRVIIKITDYLKKAFEVIQASKYKVLNFTEEFIYRHTTKINTRKLEKMVGQDDVDYEESEDPIELMKKKMKLMMTIDKPQKLRKIKIQNKIPRLPKEIIKDMPSFKSIFREERKEIKFNAKSPKLPKTSLVNTDIKKLSALDKIE
jgi:hypothetical protein